MCAMYLYLKLWKVAVVAAHTVQGHPQLLQHSTASLGPATRDSSEKKSFIFLKKYYFYVIFKSTLSTGDTSAKIFL